MPTRLDYGTLDKPERTPQGGLRAPAFLTRAGVFEYKRVDGSTVREYRPQAEVAKAESLATLRGAPITRKHPPEGRVDSANFRERSVGHVGDGVRMDGARVAAEVVIQDAAAVAAVERGEERQISCGYNCRTDDVAGVVPAGEPDAGQSYDRVQRDISYNHVAMLARGRAGDGVAIRLDAHDNAITEEKRPMKFERIDGVEYELGTDAHLAAVKRRDERVKAEQAELAAAKQRADQATGRADAAEAKLKTTEAELTKVRDPKAIGEAVKARTELVTRAARIAPELKCDGLTDREVIEKAIAAAEPETKLDGRSDDYVRAYFDRATKDAGQTEDHLRRQREGADGPPPARRADSADDKKTRSPIDVSGARREMQSRSEGAWKTTTKPAA